MEGWVKNWLVQQRAKGEKGLEVKNLGNNLFVYRSKTYWDKKLHKKRKTSTYLGRLDKTNGLIPSGAEKPPDFKVKTVTQYGNSMLLHHVLDPVIPVLKSAFPDDWMELQALAIVRALNYTPLKAVRDEWEFLYNRDGIMPDLSAKNLSRMLQGIGSDRFAQDQIFKHLKAGGNMFVYDLSCLYSASQGVSLAEKGYNKDRVHALQINLALLCSVDEHLPVMIRALPGSIKDIKTLYNSVLEVGLEGKTLILDRGFYSDEAIKFLSSKNIDYIVPTKKNSTLYLNHIVIDSVFKYDKRLIHAGNKRLDENRVLYLFEDQDLRLEEHKNLYDLLMTNQISRDEYLEGFEKSGRILLVSNKEETAEQIYRTYKKRDVVEKMFDDFKNTLDADRTYLQDDLAIHGHAFTSFLSLYIICKLQDMLKKAELKHSPKDLLRAFKKTSHIQLENYEYITEPPRQTSLLEETLHLDIHPKKRQN